MSTPKNKQDDESNLKILRELLAAGGNRNCFDCGQRGPTYVNTTIGSFVCTACSGRLRGLTPPHRIKSITMATFTSDEMDFIRSRGNDFCRKVWLGRHESPVHNQSDSVEEGQVTDDLTQKYEKKQWYVDPTEEMYEEARKANASVPFKKVKATLISQAHQNASSSRGVPSVGTQSIQRPMPGNVRTLPGAATRHANPTVSSVPQSPNKFSPQTPKSTIAPPVWGIQESPSTFQAGMANFADFSSFDFVPPPQQSIFSTGLAFGCQPFSPPSSSAKESFISTGDSYKPPVPVDRYAALAELDSTCGSDASEFSTCGAYTNDKGLQSQHLPPSGATNPFGSSTVAAVSSATFLPPCTVLSSPFVPMTASHAMNVQTPSYFGAIPQSGVSRNNNSYISQQFAAANSSNPFMNLPRQNVTNPFL